MTFPTINTRVHILTAGFTSPNGCAFLMPLIVHDRALRDRNISVRIFERNSASLTDCDTLIIDSKYYSTWWAKKKDKALEEISRLKDQLKNLIYVNIQDSAGWDHAEALPLVTLYCKAQLFADKSKYLKPLYGYRAFSDYYHDVSGVEDANPVYSAPVQDPAHLDKLTLSWNSGLADYSWFGPYKQSLYRRWPWRKILGYPASCVSPSANRERDVSCRIGTNYIRQSVSYQRQEIARRLETHLETDKLSRKRYLREMANSKLVVSPFGLGEITLRDFEVFMAGSVLLKPDMSHMETWPNFFVDGETMVTHRWDLADIEEKIESILSNYDHYLSIATEGQNRYHRHLVADDAANLFADHFASILQKAEAQSR